MNDNPKSASRDIRQSFARRVHAWNRFWFKPADPTTLGLVRICCGMLALYVHFSYSYDLQEFFGRNSWFNLETANEFRRESPWVAPSLGWDDAVAIPETTPSNLDEHAGIERYRQRWGIDPRLTSCRGNSYWSIWFHVSDPAAMTWVHGIVLTVMMLFTLGFCTRVTSVLTWLAALSYIQRSPVTLFGMDSIMIVTLLYLMIGPSGEALSLDRYLARRWQGWSRWAGIMPRSQPLASANFALRLMQVHFCFIYAAAGLSKLLGGSWWNGTALWWTLVNHEFTPLRYSFYADCLRWLCQHRLAWELVTTGGVVFTLALEISFPFLVWNPRFRGPLVAGAVLLHTGISLIMGLAGFGMIMLSLVLSFLPSETIRELLDGFQAAYLPPSGKHPPRARPMLARGGACASSRAFVHERN